MARPTPKVRTIFCSSLCHPRAMTWLFLLLQAEHGWPFSQVLNELGCELVLTASLHYVTDNTGALSTKIFNRTRKRRVGKGR